jgi:two-component system chemotaxis response regulator CheY
MKDKNSHFLLIDDDEINNFLSREILNMYLPFAKIDSFTNPEKALEYIQEKLATKQPLPDIILLDINMPLMDGWEFLKALDQLDRRSHFNTVVYLYTSSVYHEDKLKAQRFPMVRKLLTKPLSQEAIEEMTA